MAWSVSKLFCIEIYRSLVYVQEAVYYLKLVSQGFINCIMGGNDSPIIEFYPGLERGLRFQREEISNSKFSMRSGMGECIANSYAPKEFFLLHVETLCQPLESLLRYSL